jgi:integrase
MMKTYDTRPRYDSPSPYAAPSLFRGLLLESTVDTVFTPSERTLALCVGEDKVDVKTVQEILRHQNLKTTLAIYAKSMSEDRLLAQGMFLELLFSHKKPELLDGVVLRQ